MLDNFGNSTPFICPCLPSGFDLRVFSAAPMLSVFNPIFSIWLWKITWLRPFVASLVALLTSTEATVAQTFEESCSALASNVDFHNAHVQFAEYIPSETNLTFPYDVCELFLTVCYSTDPAAGTLGSDCRDSAVGQGTGSRARSVPPRTTAGRTLRTEVSKGALG